MDTLEVLARTPYFSDLNDKALRIIVRQVTPQTCAANEIVFLDGEPCTGLYIVVEGWLKAIKTSPDGREHVLHHLGPDEVINSIGVFANSQNPATVIALEPSRLLLIRKATMLTLVEQFPALSRRIIQNLSERVLHLVAMVEDLSLRSVEARLSRYLLEQATGDVVQRQKWVTQAEIASRLGTVPDVLNRALRHLAEENLLRVHRNQIEILDRPALEARAQLNF